MKKAIYIALTLVILSSLLLGSWGCNGSTSSSGGEGGVLNLYGTDPWTLDPAISSDATSHEYIIQLFSGLVRLDEDLEPAPDIAESWEISADGCTYTFYLREDVYFHNGWGVTADDFKYSWERACNPATGSQTASTYLGDIVGADEVLAGLTTEISGVRVVDDYTLEVTIDSPKSYFLSKLTYNTTFVVDEDNVATGAGWWYQPNGTGPFKLQQWQSNNLLVLERNELYYGEMADVDQVIFQLYGGVSVNLYETGEIDVASVSTSYVERASDENGLFAGQLTVVPELSFYYIGFNCAEPPFDDANIRQAFTLAIDKEKLVSLVFGGTMQSAYGILPPGIPGYNDGLVGLEYNIERAKTLIAHSSYGDVANLPEITVTTAGWGGAILAELEALVYQWRENLGVEVTVRQLEPERFLYHLDEEVDQMFYSGWIADYPHPQDFLEVLFHSDSENNTGGYSNSEVDELLDRAGAEANTSMSLALYQQAERVLVEDAACIPLCFGQNYVLVKPYIDGYRLNLLGFAMLNEVSIEPH